MKTQLRNYLLAASVLILGVQLVSCECENSKKTVVLSKEVLLDKVKGGWAGQTFGCTYGGPTEFKFNGRMIPDSVSIPWTTGYCKWWFEHDSGLYDDIYMDLTFVDMFEKHGFDVSQDTIARAFAHADYKLWHANQVARYNILNGIPAPQSGHWKNNPHADDIDFQIEADFAGLMAPGMPNTASELCDKVGHIMCYGDGWYGGVYVAAMYTLAFVSDDIDFVVEEALKTIPEQSDYHKCISDVIRWSRKNENWQDTWRLIHDKWTNEISCPKSLKRPVSIDAKVNSAYVVMGLLYGRKDMERTIDVSTRCGNDSDCNPATAAGILGTMLGYSNIPTKWINNVKEIEDICFDHTDISLNKAYEMSYRHAVEMIARNGGDTSGDHVVIHTQQPQTVRYEKGFEGLELVKRDDVKITDFSTPFSYRFNGTGVVLDGKLRSLGSCPSDYVAQVEVQIDGISKQIALLPVDFIVRKKEIYWDYDLSEAPHTVTLTWLNPIQTAQLFLESVIIYNKSH